jgi:hypothetical protein
MSKILGNSRLPKRLAASQGRLSYMKLVSSVSTVPGTSEPIVHGAGVTMKNAVFWHMMPRGPCQNGRFGGAYRFHHQGENISSQHA